MYSPTKEYADGMSAQGFGAIPVSRQMLSDVRTPIEVLRALMENDRHCFILGARRTGSTGAGTHSSDSTPCWTSYAGTGRPAS